MIYLDNAATSFGSVQSHTTTFWANASSRTHRPGLEARKEVERARAALAELIGLEQPELVVFTSGATESASIIIKALRKWNLTIQASQVEHSCVSRYVDQHHLGTLHSDVFFQMLVNNETGIQYPTPEGKADLIVSDITQGVGKVEAAQDVGFADIRFGSAHKFHGPLGVGFIAVKDMDLWDLLRSHENAGSQERGVRPGTLNAPAIIETGNVARWLLENQTSYKSHLYKLRDSFENAIRSLTICNIIGAETTRSPHITSLCLPGVDNEALIAAVNDRLAISSGSACTSEKIEPSKVLMAMFNDREIAETTVRISYGWNNTEQEVMEAAEIIAKAAESIRSFSL
jgi:cysteine desulfurase